MRSSPASKPSTASFIATRAATNWVITGPVAATDGMREVVVMDGQLAQPPHDLQANRYRTSLVTHELPGLRATRLPQEPGRSVAR